LIAVLNGLGNMVGNLVKKLMSQSTILPALVMTVFAATTTPSKPACAFEVVNNLSIESAVVRVGEPGPAYYAQSFKALANRLDEISVLLASDLGPDAFDFNLLVTETAPRSSGGYYPTNVLFESPRLTLPFDPSVPYDRLAFTRFDIPVGQFLQPGNTYMFIVDAFAGFDGVQGTAASVLNDNYNDGSFIYYAGDVGVGDRNSHFADATNWANRTMAGGFGGEEDLGFQLRFATIPEASTLHLIAIAVCVALRQRVRKSFCAGRV
jgi:hypothetical protein